MGSADILGQMADRCYLEKNINYARAIAVEGDILLLRRRPAMTSDSGRSADTGPPPQALAAAKAAGDK